MRQLLVILIAQVIRRVAADMITLSGAGQVHTYIHTYTNFTRACAHGHAHCNQVRSYTISERRYTSSTANGRRTCQQNQDKQQESSALFSYGRNMHTCLIHTQIKTRNAFVYECSGREDGCRRIVVMTPLTNQTTTMTDLSLNTC